MSNILIEKFIEISESENLLTERLAANNERLDIYKDRMSLRNKYIEILRPHVVKDEFVKKQRAIQKENDDKSIILSETNFEAIQNCSTWFRYNVDNTWSHHKLTRANRCHHKYCPQCARVQALKRTMEAQYLMMKLQEEGYVFLFLTLTTKNCEAHEISETMLHMNKALNQNFLLYKDIKKVFHGNIRKFELTYNPYKYKNNKLVLENGKRVIDKNKKPFNAHIHMIIAVKRSYFGKRYIKQQKLRELWKKALRVDYLPQVNIKRVKLREEQHIKNIEEEHSEHDKILSNEVEKQRIIDGAFEIGKYMAKSTDYLISDEMFHIFYESLFKKRNWTMSGVFRELKKEAKEQNIKIEDELLYKQIEFIHIVEYNYNEYDENFYMTRFSKKDNEKEKIFNELLEE